MLRLCWSLLLGLVLVRAQDNSTGYTDVYCGNPDDTCSDFCAQGANQIYRSDINNRFPDKQVTLDKDDLQRFQSLQQEYLVQFGDNAMYGATSTSLPGCGTNITKPATSSLRRRKTDDWDEEITAKQQSTSPSKPNCIQDSMQVTVNFNIITTNISVDSVVTLSMIDQQMDKLSTAYQPLGVTFQRGAFNRYTGAQWQPVAQDLHAPDMDKVSSLLSDIRNGKGEQLNVYVVEKIEDIQCYGETMMRVDGFCTYPSDANATYDGCYIDIDSLPGSAWRGSIQGDGGALIHELGHWFGLRHVHVSADDNCRAPESSYAETPSYMGSDQYTNLQKTCCADEKGNYKACDGDTHHVTNWMSFSEDRGMIDRDNATYPWTLGQRAAMFANYYHFRHGTDNITCPDGSSMYNNATTPSSKQKDSSINKRKSDTVQGTTQQLLAQPIFIMDTLKKVCAAPDNGGTTVVDPVTGLFNSHTSDGKGPWEALGQWRWVVITAIIIVSIVVPMWAAMCIVRQRHKKMRAKYEKLGEPARAGSNKRFSFDSVLTLNTRTVESEKVLEAYRGTGPVRYA